MCRKSPGPLYTEAGAAYHIPRSLHLFLTSLHWYTGSVASVSFVLHGMQRRIQRAVHVSVCIRSRPRGAGIERGMLTGLDDEWGRGGDSPWLGVVARGHDARHRINDRPWSLAHISSAYASAHLGLLTAYSAPIEQPSPVDSPATPDDHSPTCLVQQHPPAPRLPPRGHTTPSPTPPLPTHPPAALGRAGRELFPCPRSGFADHPARPPSTCLPSSSPSSCSA